MIDKQYIYGCILWHAIEAYHDEYLSLAKDLADNYTLEDVLGGVIAWRWDDEETIYLFEAKDQFEPKGEWAFKVLKAMDEIPKREGAKKLKIRSRSEKIKRVMGRKGFKEVGTLPDNKPSYILVREV